MSNLLRHSKLFLDKNSASILTCIGGLGVIVATTMAIKATPKALDRINTAREQRNRDLTKLEVVKTAATVYIPTTIAATATIACIFGANALNKRHQTSIINAYMLLDASYKAYKEKTKELYGKNSDTKIREAIAKDRYEESTVDISINDDDGKQLFFEQFSGRYFRSTMEDVQRATYDINRSLAIRKYAYLNDFYKYLGLEPIKPGREYGWTSDELIDDQCCVDWIDFTYEKVVMDDGLECYIIAMKDEPMINFADYN